MGGRVFSPLDEELGLGAASLAPRQQEHLVQLDALCPSQPPAGSAGELGNSPQDDGQAGLHMQAAQTQQAHAPFQDALTEQSRPSRLALSADGAMVALLKGQWAEVRTLAIGEIKAQQHGEAKHEPRVEQVSYFSRFSTAEVFTDLAEVEMRRRHVIQAQEVCVVADGADWLQAFFDLHRPDAVRILDFPHAAEHVAQLLQAAEKAGLPFPPDMLARCLPILKHPGPSLLLRMAGRLPNHLAEHEGIREHLGYLRKRETLMQYPHFRQHGWPIGSGMVESANKLVVKARLKGSGMHWHPSHVNPMLALRNGVCSERWQET